MGVFGDSFGALNTLFSGLAFSGIIVSIVLQSQQLKLNMEEIRLNREELEQTRNEIEEQGEQFKLQTKAMQKQVFESSFFSMVNLHNTISSKLRDGKDFKYMNAMFIHTLKTTNHNEKTSIEYLRCVYEKFMVDAYPKIGHYFRHIYQIVKFIDLSSLSEEDKIIYSNILRAQLSSDEIMLLYINCLCYQRSDKFKKLVEKYCFFEHIYDADLKSMLEAMNEYKVRGVNGELTDLYSLNDVKSLYSPQAYGEC